MDPRDEPFSAKRIDEQIERLLEQPAQPAQPITASASARLIRQLRRLYRQQATAQRERSLARAWERIAQQTARRSLAASNHVEQRTALHLAALRRETVQPAPDEHSAEMFFTTHKGFSTMNTKRVRGFAALVTLAVVVAVFALLFTTILPRRADKQTLGASGTPKPTVNATTTSISLPAGQWTESARLNNFSGDLPTVMIAPENPNILYESSTPPGTSSTLILRRSDDGGKIWHSLANPGGLPAAFDSASIAVSPLDPQVVIVTLTIYEGAHPGACQTASTGSNALARSSGGASCGAQYYSSDGGQHWSRLKLPIAGALGATNVNISNPTSEDVLRPQGQRLYSAVSSSTVINVTFGASARIIASDDGGKTWKLVDAGLIASGQNICNYAPTPTGSTIFAVTQASACYGPDTPNAQHSLWRSDDAGAHWTQISTFPGLTRQITLADLGAGTGSLLYIQLFPPPSLPSTPGPGSATPTPDRADQGDAGILFSKDAGHTWQKTPASGIVGPGGNSLYPYTATGPIATLSDGSVVAAFPTKALTFIFAAWKPGDDAWHAIAPALAHIPMLDSFQITSGADGKTTFWVIAQNASGTLSIFRYDQQ
jgi:hypothetical protein